MRKYLSVLLVIFLNMSYLSHAQLQEGYSKKIDSLQIDYITKELVLTRDESRKFWPIYTNYKNEIKTVRKEIERDPIALEEKILNIRKKYKYDFKQILEGEERVNKVYVLEKSFIEMLRNELLERQSKGEGSKGEDSTAKQEDTTNREDNEDTTKEDTNRGENTPEDATKREDTKVENN